MPRHCLHSGAHRSPRSTRRLPQRLGPWPEPPPPVGVYNQRDSIAWSAGPGLKHACSLAHFLRAPFPFPLNSVLVFLINYVVQPRTPSFIQRKGYEAFHVDGGSRTCTEGYCPIAADRLSCRLSSSHKSTEEPRDTGNGRAGSPS